MSTKTTTKQASVKQRIRLFYKVLNDRDFHQCFEMIDPRIRRKPVSITRFQYENALRQFLDHVGPVKKILITIRVHSNEPTQLYEGRDFAVGKTSWTDSVGGQHAFSERWVREGHTWYTRSTGFIVPSIADVESNRKQGEGSSPRRPAGSKRNGKSKSK